MIIEDGLVVQSVLYSGVRRHLQTCISAHPLGHLRRLYSNKDSPKTSIR